MLIHLFDEKRVAVRLLVQDTDERRGRRRAGQPMQHLLDAGRGETLDGNARRQPLPQEGFERVGKRTLRVELDVAVRPDKQQAHRSHVWHHMQQQLERRVVRPVQVVEQHHHRRFQRRAADVIEIRGEQQPPLLIGRHDRRVRNVVVDAAQAWHERRNLRRGLAERGAIRLRQRARRLVADLHERPVRRRALLFVALPGHHEAAPLVREALNLPRQARFANAGLAAEQDETALAEQHPIERLLELADLALAADKRRPLLRLARPGRGWCG